MSTKQMELGAEATRLPPQDETFASLAASPRPCTGRSLKPNAARMQLAVDFVTAHASTGVTMRSTIFHVLESFGEDKREKPTAYKQAAGVVERIIKDRHVRQGPDLSLYPWDEKRKAYAEALERAHTLAPTPREKAIMFEMVLDAWRRAGDEGRVRMLMGLHGRSSENPPSPMPG